MAIEPWEAEGQDLAPDELEQDKEEAEAMAEENPKTLGNELVNLIFEDVREEERKAEHPWDDSETEII